MLLAKALPNVLILGKYLNILNKINALNILEVFLTSDDSLIVFSNM
jgi:hypothetical protein